MTDTAVDAEESLFKRVKSTLRTIIGAPNYAAYVKHVQEHHPGVTPLTEREFLDERLTARYSTPGSRCC
jgi:uncharacterized short protein YbdD (DUF466 family)